MQFFYKAGCHYSWKLLECNLTPGKMKNSLKTPGKRSWIEVEVVRWLILAHSKQWKIFKKQNSVMKSEISELTEKKRGVESCIKSLDLHKKNLTVLLKKSLVFCFCKIYSLVVNTRKVCLGLQKFFFGGEVFTCFPETIYTLPSTLPYSSVWIFEKTVLIVDDFASRLAVTYSKVFWAYHYLQSKWS